MVELSSMTSLWPGGESPGTAQLAGEAGPGGGEGDRGGVVPGGVAAVY